MDGRSKLRRKHRWRSIRIYHTKLGWVWADYGGWGYGVFPFRIQALYTALKGEK